MANQPDYSAYTESVIAAIGSKASPRVNQALPILIRHLHAAVIESGLTTEEWLESCDLLIEAGKISSDKRNEMVLVSDVLGVETLVDMYVMSLERNRLIQSSLLLIPPTGLNMRDLRTMQVKQRNQRF